VGNQLGKQEPSR